MVQSANGRMVEGVFKIAKFEFELMRKNDGRVSAPKSPDSDRVKCYTYTMYQVRKTVTYRSIFSH
jgi:hypothetical protein